jgi:erythromycin esterase-like protein
MGKTFFGKHLIFLAYFVLLFLCSRLTFGQERSDTIYSSKVDIDFISSISKHINDRRVVMLGEPTHEEGNILAIKIELIKYLVEQNGFSVIAIESGIYDLWKANKNIRSGLGYTQSLRDGIFPVWSCSREMESLFTLLEKWQDKVTVIGFDSQFSGEYASESLLEDLIEVIDIHKLRYDTSNLEFWASSCTDMAETFTVSKDFDIEKFNKISNDLIELLAKTKANEDLQFWNGIIKSSQALAADYFYNSPSSISKNIWKASDSNSRDKQMANNLLLLMEIFKNRKVICWGASTHFAKGFSGIDNDELHNYLPMGKIVSDSLGDQEVYSIAFTGASGMVGLDSTSSRVLQKASLGSLESNLDLNGVEFAFVKMRKDHQAFTSRSIENVELFGYWNQTFDAFIFSKQITPNILDCDDQLNDNFVIEQNDLATDKATIESHVNKNDNLRDYFTSIYSAESISGNLFNSATNEPIPYAHLVYMNSEIGSISELDGSFKLYRSKFYDSLKISSIGYKTRIISIEDLRINQGIISMEPDIIELNGVTIRGEKLSPKKILKRVIKAFKSNYLQKEYTALMTISKSKRLQNTGLIESVINDIKKIDRNGYTFSSPYPIRNDDLIELISSKAYLIDTLSFDTISVAKEDSKIRSSLAFMDLLNYRKNTFFNPAKWSAFDFELTDVIVNQDGSETYKIIFRCTRPSHFNTLQLAPTEYWGEIYVLSSDYAVIKFTTFTRQNKFKIWQAERFPAFQKKETWFNNTVVTYKKINGYYFLETALYFSNWDGESGLINMRLSKVDF